jgi:hypothetical protein
MSVTYLGDNNPDGVSVGLSATEKVSLYGVTPVVQATIAAAGTDATTTQALANLPMICARN